MVLHLVRHADAGDRGAWTGPEDERPLSARGRRRAEELVVELGGAERLRVLSSPALRCIETVEPLADAAGVAVEVHPALAEGAPLEAAWALLEALAGEAVGDVVACSHGDVIPDVLERLSRRGVALTGSGRGVAKGSVWTCALDHVASQPEDLDRAP